MQSVRVLVVDEDLLLARALTISLAAHGDVVHCLASIGQDGPFPRADVVLVGLSLLSTKDEIAAAETIVRLRSTYGSPVIGLTHDWSSARLKEETHAAGADAWLRKPFDVRQLWDCIHEVVRDARDARVTLAFA